MDGDARPPLEMCCHEGVLTIILTRPETGNALTPDMVAALTAAFALPATDRAIRAVLLRATGAHFTTGGDVRSFATLAEGPADERRAAFAGLLADGTEMVLALAAIEVPVIVACRGVVAGGGLALVLAADIVLADDSARFLFSHRRIGLPPDGGVSWLLPRLVGPRRAAELILTGATVEAERALGLGLVSRLVARDALEAEGRQLADDLAAGPTHALRAAKALLRDGADRTLAEQLAQEGAAVLAAIEDTDFAEGVRALIERRSPAFRRDT